MLKKSKALMISSGVILAGAAATGVAVSAVSCSSNESEKGTTSTTVKPNNAYKLYKEFVYGTHGRWAGNYANFIPKTENKRSENIGTHTFGQYGLNTTNLSHAGFTNITNPKQQIKLQILMIVQKN